jgi:hypothetical protein
MPGESEEPVEAEQASDMPEPKRLVTLISTKGKTPEEAAAEIMANWRKYKESSE